MNGQIIIVGLGAGDIDQLPLGVYRTLSSAAHVFLRTKEHPVVQELEREGMKYTSFDDIYEQNDQFEQVYEQIKNLLIAEAQNEEIVYAVPGHPLVAEKNGTIIVGRRATK